MTKSSRMRAGTMAQLQEETMAHHAKTKTWTQQFPDILKREEKQ